MEVNNIITTVSSKGQVTIPLYIRRLLHITQAGDLIRFIPTQEGVLLKHLEVKEDDFTQDEWDKLEKIANTKGKTYKDVKTFLRALRKL